MADTRLTLRQAAAALGVSESAIRKRVERGTLRSDKGPDGRRYVYLDEPGLADVGADTSATHEHGTLISELRAHNATLREQLEAERRANEENRRIIAALTSRIPELEPASPEASEKAPEGATEGSDRGTAAPQTAETRETAESPWWKRWFGR